jgi:co-chaperonin GroES (HSP10)
MLTPLAKKIIVKPVEVKHGNLIVSGQKPSQYKIITIGDEVTKVKPDDIIYLEKHYGAEIEHEKEKFLVIEEASILAKLSASVKPSEGIEIPSPSESSYPSMPPL